jgi:hypothetical protein
VFFTCIFAGGLGLFFGVYYSVLALFFLGMITVFYQTLNSDVPRLTGTDSLLKAIPGM